MVKLNKIYTRTGDKGDTGLGDGKRVRKYDIRVAAFGTVDEANAAIGLARLHTTGDPDAALGRIQNDLFDLGADLCTPESPQEKPGEGLRISDAQVVRLEHEIDALNARLSPLNSFILPGGSHAAAYLHLARTISRRAERLMVELADGEIVNPAALRYINRLSDFLFVIGRHVNNDGATDVLWLPGQNR
ncbi:MAG: cob(I)yrinic acid a,c-diamide adenosyltransferase [Alphaproteobacteria bacterium]